MGNRTDTQCRYLWQKIKASQRVTWTTQEDELLISLTQTRESSTSICWEEVATKMTKKVSPQPRTSLDCKRRWEELQIQRVTAKEEKAPHSSC
jgi:hypothetical protein